MNTRSLTSLLNEKFAFTPRDHYAHIFSLAVKYLKEVFKGHTIINSIRRADYHKREVLLQLDITVRLRDGSVLTDIICNLGRYDILFPERGMELIKMFDLSKAFEGLVERWYDDDDDVRS